LSKVDLRIDWATHEAAKYACENWHYSGCIPKSKLAKVGIWEDDVFIGVIIFGVGATSTLVQQYGLKMNEGCELVRIALKKHKTPVTRLMSISQKFLKKSMQNIRLIVSFADPSEGHHGGIYQGNGWIYTGKSADCAFPMINGKKTHPRTLSLLVKSGKVKNRSDVPHVMTEGKHRYLMPLDNEMRERIMPLAKPYPKRMKQANSGDQPESGGAAPTHALQSLQDASI
jgi:hypothetical protein